MSRVILHLDANSFYVSVGCLYRPEIRSKPVSVCGDPEARYRIVLTSNQLAKKRVVKTGMALWQARQGINRIAAAFLTVVVLTVIIDFLVAGFSKRCLVAVVGSLAGTPVTCGTSILPPHRHSWPRSVIPPRCDD